MPLAAVPPGTSHDHWREAPLRHVLDLTQGEPCLVLAPHADDETIGCGGLILQACAQGVTVHADIMTDGSKSHPRSIAYGRERLAALRQREATAAAMRLGLEASALRFWDEPDGDLHAHARLIARLLSRLEETQAANLFVTCGRDPHCDHQAAFVIARAAVRASAKPIRLFAYPVWSWTIGVRPEDDEGRVWRLDIRAELAAKRDALDHHASQLGRVIADDPTGFVLGGAELALFLQSFETFIEVSRDREDGV